MFKQNFIMKTWNENNMTSMVQNLPKIKLNILKITWGKLCLFIYYYGLSSRRNISKYFKISLKISTNIFCKFLIDYKCTMDERMKGEHSWMNSIHDDVSNNVVVMLAMMLAMMLVMILGMFVHDNHSLNLIHKWHFQHQFGQHHD